MNKAEFMSRLTVALAGLPMEERQAALKYYEEYFEEAGPEREVEILAELGDPQQVAKSILQDYSGVPATPEQAAAEQAEAEKLGGATTAQATAEQPDATAGQTSSPNVDAAAGQVRRTFDGVKDYAERLRLPVWLWIVIAIFGLPVLLGIFGVIMGAVGGVLGVVMGLIGAVVGLIAATFGVFFAVAFGGFALVVGGFSSVVAGVFRFMVEPASGILAIGIGALLASLGLLLCMLGWWLIKTVLPKLWAWFAGACREMAGVVRGWFGKRGNK